MFKVKLTVMLISFSGNDKKNKINVKKNVKKILRNIKIQMFRKDINKYLTCNIKIKKNYRYSLILEL